MSEVFKATSLDHLKKKAEELRSQLEPRHIVLLSGPVGAGKTTLVQYLAGQDVGVTSPSFALHNHYETPWGVIEHVDLYRLDDEDDLESTGFWDLFDTDQAWIIIEWADRLDKSALPKGWPVKDLVLG